MLKKFLTSITTLVMLYSAYSQHTYEFGLEASLLGDSYKVKDPAMTSPLLITAMAMLKGRKYFKHNFFAEAALGGKSYEGGVGFKFNQFYGQFMTTLTGMAQVRFGKKIRIVKEKIAISPVIGYAFCVNGYGKGDQGGEGGSTWQPGGDSLSYSHNALILHRTFSLIQAGVCAEFFLSKRFTLEILRSKYFGLNNVFEQDVIYQFNSSPPRTTTQTSKGSFGNFGAGIKYKW